MNNRRDYRSSRASLLDEYDSIEEGGIQASTSSSFSRPIDESNDPAMTSLHDRVTFLKKLTGNIHEEVENRNRQLDWMGDGMDSSRGIMSTTKDRFMMVIKKKSCCRMCKLAASFIISFILIYHLIRFLHLP